MPLASNPPAIPLPKAWPQHTKLGLLHAVALAHRGLISVRAWCANSRLERVRLAAQNERLLAENAMLREEVRIKDARMHKLAPARRPQYAPTDRLAILMLKAARGWNNAQAARAFLVTAATIAAWMRRIDQNGKNALVRTPEPVNRFPDFVVALVQQLKATFPVLGNRQIANFLGRAGLHLAATTVARMLARPRAARPLPPAPQPVRAHDHADASTVEPHRPGDVWHADITLVPTSIGFWIPWVPGSQLLSWPFCWHVVAVLDHFSRRVLHIAVFRSAPTADQLCTLLDEAVARVGRAPRHMVTDQGVQFRYDYRAWCQRNAVEPRFGAVGKKGSIALIERFFLTLKNEATRRIDVPYSESALRDVLVAFVGWYNDCRPHSALRGATPTEAFDQVLPAREQTVLETRARFPVAADFAEPGSDARERGPPSVRRVSRLALRTECVWHLPHLPRVSLDEAA